MTTYQTDGLTMGPVVDGNGARSSTTSSRSTVDRQVADQSNDNLYDTLLWRLRGRQAALQGSRALTVGLSGCKSRSGTTTIATNLAVRASKERDGRVLLIEANWQTPRLQRLLRLPPGPGLAEVLAGSNAPQECIEQGPNELLDVLPGGHFDQDRSARVCQENISALVELAQSQYGLVVVDLPPAESLRHTLLLAKALDGVLLVVRSEAARQAQVQRVMSLFEQDGVPLWGAIMNRQPQYIPNWLRRWV